MPILSTPAILLRRIDYGDYDLIITLLTFDAGKISVIAKSAKKSIKRFSGVLELFSVLNVILQNEPAQRSSCFAGGSLEIPISAYSGGH